MEGNIWDYPKIYLQARHELDSVLLRHGYRPHRERYDYFAFGSAMAVYRRKQDDHYLSLGWDGREFSLSLDASDDGRNYKAVASSPAGLQAAGVDQVAVEIGQLAVAAESFIASRSVAP